MLIDYILNSLHKIVYNSLYNINIYNNNGSNRFLIHKDTKL